MSQPIYHSISSPNCGCRKDGPEKFVIVASVWAIVFSLCAVAITLLVFQKHESNRQALMTNLNRTPIVCVPCWRLAKNDSDALISKLSILQDDAGDNKCCAYDSQQMSLVFQLALRHGTAPESLLESNAANFTFSSVSAHKMLHQPKGETNITGPKSVSSDVVISFMKEHKSVSEHSRGVDVQEDGLTIQTSGRYFIYSSIHFRPAYPCRDFAYQTWGHYVEKITLNDPANSGYILKTTHTCCDECKGDDETSFTGSIFELKKGDKIRILVSEHGLVHFQRSSSFAGLMIMVGEDARE